MLLDPVYNTHAKDQYCRIYTTTINAISENRHTWNRHVSIKLTFTQEAGILNRKYGGFQVETTLFFINLETKLQNYKKSSPNFDGILFGFLGGLLPKLCPAFRTSKLATPAELSVV